MKLGANVIKQWGRIILERAGFYQRLKSSWIYDFYWKYADPKIIEDRDKEVSFYTSILEGFKKGDVIFDIGANQGHKSDIFLKLGAKVIAADPDETNQEVLKQRFLGLRLIPKPVVVVGKALSDSITVMTMWIDAPGSAKNTLNPKWVKTLRHDDKRFGQRLDFKEQKIVQTTTLEALTTEYGVPFFVKIDVEGYEASVLQGLKHPVPYLSFEVNLPEFRLEGLQCVKSLNAVAPDGEFNYVTDCRNGLCLKKWLPCYEFSALFERCEEPSIEVFWRTFKPARVPV